MDAIPTQHPHTHILTSPLRSSRLIIVLMVRRAASRNGTRISTFGRVSPWSRGSLGEKTASVHAQEPVENGLTPFLCPPVQHRPVVCYSSELEIESYNRNDQCGIVKIS